MDYNEFRILAGLISRYETEVPPGTVSPLSIDLLDRIKHKIAILINTAPGVTDPYFLFEMERIGYPLLPLQQDLVSVYLYGLKTTKGMIEIKPMAFAA